MAMDARAFMLALCWASIASADVVGAQCWPTGISSDEYPFCRRLDANFAL